MYNAQAWYGKFFSEDAFDMAEVDDRIELDWEALEVGETFDKFEYL